MIWTKQSSYKPSIGEMYYDTEKNATFVFTGQDWALFGSELEKYNTSISIEKLCELHPGLDELKKELDNAQERFDAYLILVKENN